MQPFGNEASETRLEAKPTTHAQLRRRGIAQLQRRAASSSDMAIGRPRTRPLSLFGGNMFLVFQCPEPL
jgi:hypothetical protein